MELEAVKIISPGLVGGSTANNSLAIHPTSSGCWEERNASCLVSSPPPPNNPLMPPPTYPLLPHTSVFPSPCFQSSPQGCQYKKTSLPEDLTVLGLSPPDSMVSL